MCFSCAWTVNDEPSAALSASYGSEQSEQNNAGGRNEALALRPLSLFISLVTFLVLFAYDTYRTDAYHYPINSKNTSTRRGRLR